MENSPNSLLNPVSSKIRFLPHIHESFLSTGFPVSSKYLPRRQPFRARTVRVEEGQQPYPFALRTEQLGHFKRDETMRRVACKVIGAVRLNCTNGLNVTIRYF